MSLRLRQEIQAVPRAFDLTGSGKVSAVSVLVGLIRDTEGRVLINQRRFGTHRAGEWEFPGGKRRSRELPFAALRRELAEELGIDVLEAEPFLQLTHDYGDRLVELDIWRVRRYDGEPHSREGQPLQWVTPRELARIALLPADRPIVEALLRGD